MQRTLSMKLLLLLLIICSAVSAQAANEDTTGSAGMVKLYPARNAYELAQRLNQYEQGEFKGRKYDYLKWVLLNTIKQYIEHEPDSIYKYPLLNKIYTDLGMELYPPKKILVKNDADFQRFLGYLREPSWLRDSFTHYRTLYYSDDDRIPVLQGVRRGYALALDTNNQLLLQARSRNDTDTTAIVMYTQKMDSLQALIDKNTGDSLTAVSRHKDSVIGLFVKFYGRNYLAIENNFNARTNEETIAFRQMLASPQSIQAQGMEAEKATMDIINNVQYNIAQASAANASFRIPSQAEMIDAVAIYLAGRIKQEAVMWFFEQLKKNTSKYELIQEFFPNTVRLLEGNEVYEIPNMGTLWHYALSKDFTLMPKNVINSKWLAMRSPEAVKYKDFINGACDMADLMLRHYTYRETIQTLYLNGADMNPAADTGLQFYNIVRLLYAVNTEFFIPDSNTRYRLLNYSDYSRLNKDELLLMLSLVDMKYHHAFQNVFNLADKTGRFAFRDSVLSYQNMQVMLGRLEASISAFEKMRNEFVKQDKQAQDNTQQNWVYTTYSVWSSLTQMLDVLQLSANDHKVFCEGVEKNNKAFKYAGIIYESYDLISKKNYAGAVQNVLGLVDTLLYRSNPNDSLYRFSKRDSTKRKIFESSVLLGKLLQIDSFGVNEYLHKYKIKIKDGVVKIPDSIKGPKGTMIGLDRKSIADTLRKIYSLHQRRNFKFQYKDLSAFIYEFNVKNDTISFKKESPMASVFFEQDRHAVQIVQKLSGFLNDAALAQGDKQLAKVVESYAMPPGSYKRKRNNWWSLDLNAFAGAYAGYEWLPQDKVPDSNWRTKGGVYGFSVPIGIALSKTFGRRLNGSEHAQRFLDRHRQDMMRNPDLIKLNRNYIYYRTKSTLTATISIVDLGAVVSYRLSHNDDVLPQSVKWEQFISPGLHLSYAIAGTPLVANLGGQFTPKLRQLDDVTEEQYNTWRIYTGLYFDLPLLNLWEKKHRVVQ